MQPLALAKGRYIARLAASPEDMRAAQALRGQSFRASAAQGEAASDSDAFDARCLHALVEDAQDGRLLCCCRMLPLRDGSAVPTSYSAQFYDLALLSAYRDPMLELGRFCMAPDCHDPDILRLAWALITRLVDEQGVGMLFGCASFTGQSWQAYDDALALLAARHLAPSRWRPGVKAGDTVPYASRLAGRVADARRAALQLPPLLRSYLVMGGWVSDHAVIDRDLDTIHVFTALEIRAIPEARARSLRMVAAADGGGVRGACL